MFSFTSSPIRVLASPPIRILCPATAQYDFTQDTRTMGRVESRLWLTAGTNALGSPQPGCSSYSSSAPVNTAAASLQTSTFPATHYLPQFSIH
ncbi:hypothetical protein LshimejAT787_1600690 [Lyophyllum shimeji]|uniref:Uncharacterized protein n=1 Tax=Lyophyllum shimeji TaxID=47721 RepID=A0A9P3UQN3_LYOSH|nr:hypothetical protein LshimejAT787_1600690 [Lyophyllum shimeji]